MGDYENGLPPIENETTSELVSALNHRRALSLAELLEDKVDPAVAEPYLNRAVDLASLSEDDKQVLFEALLLTYPDLDMDFDYSEEIFFPEIENKEFMEFKTDSDRWQMEVARLRAAAIVAKYQTPNLDVQEYMKAEMAEGMAQTFLTHGWPLPERLKLLLTPEQLEKLAQQYEENERDREKDLGFARKAIAEYERRERAKDEEMGVDPKIVDRRADVDRQRGNENSIVILQHEAGYPERFERFMDRFPDPRILMDRILEIDSEKGTIPV